MADSVIGLLHPGEMGAALAMQLRPGRPILWASSGRSVATAQRAEQAGLRDVATVEELAESSEVILSVCPPHAALDVASRWQALGFTGVYVDANAVSPQTAREIGERHREARRPLRGRRDRRLSAAGRRADAPLPFGLHGPGRRRALSRHRRPGPGRVRRAGLGVGGQDGVRGVVQRRRCPAARDPGAGSR